MRTPTGLHTLKHVSANSREAATPMTETEAAGRDRPFALKLNWLALAALVSIAMAVMALVQKPLWRDEYWSLYFSGPGFSLDTLLKEVHPPLYYGLLKLWISISDNDVWVRSLSLLTAAIGTAAAFLIGGRSRQNVIFVLLCLSSYWFVYFASEVRPYTLNYFLTISLSLVAVSIARNGPAIGNLLGFVLLAALLGLTNYLAALFAACLGLALGINELRARRSLRGFASIGIASVLAMVPTAVWVVLSLGVFDLSGKVKDTPFLEEVHFVLNQFLRGLVVKLFGSNPLAFIVGFGAVLAAFRFRPGPTGVFAFAILLTVVISFAMHFAVVGVVLERGYIVIMPTLIWIVSERLAPIRRGEDWRADWTRFVPLAAAIMPFLFIPEYFKDRERLGEVRAVLQTHREACAGEDILVFNRPTNHDGYAGFVNRRVFRYGQGAPDPVLIDAGIESEVWRESSCPVKAAALILPKGGGDWKTAAIAAFEAKGLDVSALEERRFGKSRNVLWIAPESE